MDLSSLRTLIGQTALIDVEACRRELEHIRRGRGLFDAREVEVLARLDELAVESPAIFPEDELAKAAKSTLTNGLKIRHRKETCAQVPELGAALADGATTGDRVDVLAKATAGMTAGEVARVAKYGAVIADSAIMRHHGNTEKRSSASSGRPVTTTASSAWLDSARRHCCGGGPTPAGCGTSPANGTRSAVSNSKDDCATRSRPCSTTRHPTMHRSIRSNAKTSSPPKR